VGGNLGSNTTRKRDERVQHLIRKSQKNKAGHISSKTLFAPSKQRVKNYGPRHNDRIRPCKRILNPAVYLPCTSLRVFVVSLRFAFL